MLGSSGADVDGEAGEGFVVAVEVVDQPHLPRGHRRSLIVRGRRSRRDSSASVVRIVPPAGAALPFDLDCCIKTGPEVWGQ